MTAERIAKACVLNIWDLFPTEEAMDATTQDLAGHIAKALAAARRPRREADARIAESRTGDHFSKIAQAWIDQWWAYNKDEARRQLVVLLDDTDRAARAAQREGGSA